MKQPVKSLHITATTRPKIVWCPKVFVTELDEITDKLLEGERVSSSCQAQ